MARSVRTEPLGSAQATKVSDSIEPGSDVFLESESEEEDVDDDGSADTDSDAASDLEEDPFEIEPPPQIDPRERSSIALLLQELGEISLLTRDEEQSLATRLVRRRDRLRELLGKWPDLTSAALPLQKMTVDPAIDFRERDTIAVLVHVESCLRHPSRSSLPPRTLRGLQRQLREALTEYRTLRDQLIRANIRLVISLAKRYRRTGVALSDMVQEGVLGLIRAVEKYDPVRDVKFATYAVWWIWQQIGRAGDVHAALIRTPVHWNQLRRKLGRETVRLEHINGGIVGREELAEAAGIDTERLDTLTQGFFCISLDSPTTDDEERSLGDILPSPLADPEREHTAADLSEQLESALGKLPPREADILRLRFGTAQERALTLEEVGQRLGVSRERVRQLEARALRLLHPICQSQGLRSYID